MYKFNNDNIITGYIKQLLHSFNLPKCRVFDNEQSFKDYYKDVKDYGVFGIVKNYLDNSDYIVYLSKGDEITPISIYNYNNTYLNLTTNLSLFNNIYDSNCHKYLGNYLRFLRDYLNINLMSMYNCFSNEILIGKEYKYIIIPVKHKTKYTIAFNGVRYEYLFTYKSTLDDIEELFTSTNSHEVKKSTFNRPFLINSEKGLTSQTSSYKNIYPDFYESNYKLVIRVHKDKNDTITVLEGDYTNTKNCFVPIQANYDKKLLDSKYEKVNIDNFINNLQLLDPHIGSRNMSYPFADRLIEYLTGMAITPLDNISKNIIDAKYKELLRYTEWKNKPNIDKIKDTFDNIDRLRFLEVMSKNKFRFKNTYDLLGYVDKEIEECLDDDSRLRGN